MSFVTSILSFSKIYDTESFYLRDKSSHFIDLSDVPGTNCMCDVEAVSEIGKRTGSPCGLHFIDNGNYHYMS